MTEKMIDFSDWAAGAIQDKSKFNIRCDDLPLKTGKRAGIWLECEVITGSQDDIKGMTISYRVCTPEQKTCLYFGTLEEACTRGLRIATAWDELSKQGDGEISLQILKPDGTPF
jgi:hypothetical protein